MNPDQAVRGAQFAAVAATSTAVTMFVHDLTEHWHDLDAGDYVNGLTCVTVVLIGWVGIELLVRHIRQAQANHAEMMAALPTAESVAGHICRRMAEDRPDAQVVNLRG